MYFVCHYFGLGIKLNEEALEYTYTYQTADIIPRHPGKINETKHWNGLAQIQVSRFYTDPQIPKATVERSRPGILRIPGLVIRGPYMVTHGEGKEDAPNVSAED